MPASAAHHHETTARFYAAKRYRLALTVLQYSRGWQVQDPLQVRRNELRSAIARHSGLGVDPSNTAVFSLAPDVLYSSLRGGTLHEAPPGFPPDIAFRWSAMTEAIGHIDVMLDAERGEDGPDTGWVAHSQTFSRWLASQQRDRQQKRKAIDALLLQDLSQEIAEESAYGGATPAQMSD